jgi:tetratricopeptide (TPR) repeat protein
MHVEDVPEGEATDTLEPVGPTAAEGDGAAAGAAGAAGAATEIWVASMQPEAPVAEVAEDGVEVGGVAAELLNEAGDLLSAGDADGAAAKCREAIEIAPDLVSAYSLLGMAEEQRGNTVAAAGAYRRVLQLDPDRKVEREKLEMFYATGDAARHEGVDGETETDRRIAAWAPWVAAVAAAFLVMMTLTAVGLRVHAGSSAEHVFADQMQVAQAALDSGDYRTASTAFEAALAARPDDADAQRGLRYARRKLAPATGTSPTQTAVAQRMPYQASILPSRGPNPFSPIPIGSGNDEQPPGPEQAQGQPPQTTAPRSTPPPVMSSESVEVSRRSQQTTTPREEIMPFGQVLDEPVERPAAAADAAEEEQIAEEPERRQGEISIWLSPRSASTSQSAERPAQQPGGSAHADRGYELRRQAQAAISRGNCDQGRQLLDQAIEAYRADTAQNPARRQANQAAIATCQTLRQQCESGGNQ